MRRIFLTSTMRRPFILDDLTTLRHHYAVDFFVGSGVVDACRMFVRATRADLSICWFASVYSFAVTLGAKLAGKKSIIVVGGVDAAALPELGYGLWLSKWKSFVVRQALRRADVILVVDERLRQNLERHSQLSLEQASVLPTGYDSHFWSPPSSDTEREGVLCVATCDSEGRGRVKGVDLFLEVAGMLPDIPFRLIGVDPNFLHNFPFVIPKNVHILPPLDHAELVDYYRSASIYCQPSRHEGLSNVLCEGMLCGLIPVGTDVGGTATAIGDSGVLVPPGDADALRRGILQALSMPDESRQAVRSRIVELFPRERREKELIEIVRQLTGGEPDES
ncbi:MAG: glycosyltransferase family 4 protein [Candidatus Kapaibacterium sp.]